MEAVVFCSLPYYTMKDLYKSQFLRKWSFFMSIRQYIFDKARRLPILLLSKDLFLEKIKITDLRRLFMADTPEIKIIINKDGPKLTEYIKNSVRDDDVEGIVNAVQAYSENSSPSIMAFFNEEMEMVPQRKIIRLYISNRKVHIETAEKTYDVRKPLQEIEILLDKKRFVRISQSETINIYKVKSFDFSTAGTIGVELVNGQNTWVARRRIRNVKELLTNTAPDNH